MAYDQRRLALNANGLCEAYLHSLAYHNDRITSAVMESTRTSRGTPQAGHLLIHSLLTRCCKSNIRNHTNKDCSVVRSLHDCTSTTPNGHTYHVASIPKYIPSYPAQCRSPPHSNIPYPYISTLLSKRNEAAPSRTRAKLLTETW
jgi:hypothetical protein